MPHSHEEYHIHEWQAPAHLLTCVAEYLLGGVGLEELGALVPLVHVVRVLAQHHARQQLGPTLHQVLQPRQPEGAAGAHPMHDA
jgi:hypothetical protein